jgi:hypothetical protein
MFTDFFRGVDFDDPEYGFKEEDKDHIKVWPQTNLPLYHLTHFQ